MSCKPQALGFLVPTGWILVGIAQVPSDFTQLIAPGVKRIHSCTCSVFPFGFRRQAIAIGLWIQFDVTGITNGINRGETLERGECVAKLNGFVPTHTENRLVGSLTLVFNTIADPWLVGLIVAEASFLGGPGPGNGVGMVSMTCSYSACVTSVLLSKRLGNGHRVEHFIVVLPASLSALPMPKLPGEIAIMSGLWDAGDSVASAWSDSSGRSGLDGSGSLEPHAAMNPMIELTIRRERFI